MNVDAWRKRRTARKRAAKGATSKTYVVGNSYATTSAPGDARIFIAAYSPLGDLLWHREIVGDGLSHVGRGIAVDDFGNVYVGGSFVGTDVDFDPQAVHANGEDRLTSGAAYAAFVLKLSSSGQFQWVRRIGDNVTTWVNGKDVATDAAGNVYLSGDFTAADFDPSPARTVRRTTHGSADWFVLKLTASGEFGWVWTAGTSVWETPSGLAVDRQGYVHVTGSFASGMDFDGAGSDPPRVSHGDLDAAVLELDEAGNFVRADTFGGTGYDKATAIVVDDAGNRYITGSFVGTVDFDPSEAGTLLRSSHLTSESNSTVDAFVVKLTAAGQLGWVRQMGDYGKDEGLSIALDGQGNVLVGGYFYYGLDWEGMHVRFLNATVAPGSPWENAVDGFLINLSAAGERRWARAIGSTGQDRVHQIAVSPSGTVAVTGFFSGTVPFDTGDGVTSLTSAGGKDAFLLNLVTAPRPTVLDLVPAGGLVSEENGRTVITVPPGSSVPFSVVVQQAAAALKAFQLNFGHSHPDLQLADWVTNASAFEQASDSDLAGDLFVAAATSAGVEVSSSVQLGTFQVTAPAVGDCPLTIDFLTGNEWLDTALTDALDETLALDDLGDAILRVRWHNPEEPCDVSGDRLVSPLDALMVINYINSNSNPVLPARFAGGRSPGFLDANGDGNVAPQDVLMIINDINSRTLESGEGDAAPPAGFEDSVAGRTPPITPLPWAGMAPVLLSPPWRPTVHWRDGDVPSSSAGRSRLATTGPSIARRSDVSLAKPARSLTLDPDWEAVDARLVPLHDVWTDLAADIDRAWRA